MELCERRYKQKIRADGLWSVVCYEATSTGEDRVQVVFDLLPDKAFALELVNELHKKDKP